MASKFDMLQRLIEISDRHDRLSKLLDEALKACAFFDFEFLMDQRQENHDQFLSLRREIWAEYDKAGIIKSAVELTQGIKPNYRSPQEG